MFSFHRRSLGIEAAAIGLPLLLVYVGRGLVASPPPPSNSVQVSMPTIAPVNALATAPLTPEQQKATEWLRMLPPKYDLSSPLNHIVVDTQAPKPKPPPDIPVVQVNPIEGLKLSAVMGNDADQLAVISGKIYHIGDAVRAGLKLTEIDPRNARIVLTDAEGKTYEIKRDQK